MLKKSHSSKIRKSLFKKEDEKLPVYFGALADLSRYRIFNALLAYDKLCLCVSDVAEILGITVSAVSQHFRVMELAGLLKKTRTGQNVCYQIKSQDKRVKQIIKIIKSK